jgi:hypothetical protein
MVSHDDTVTGIKSTLLSFKEVIGIVKVYALLPSFPGLLMSLQVWVVSDEDPGLNILTTLQAI